MPLLEYPPLAIATNDFVSTFNELRHIAIVSLQPRLAGEVKECLSSIISTIRSFLPASEKSMSQEEAQVYKQMCECAAEQFAPFVVSCIEQIYSEIKCESVDITSLVLPLVEIYAPNKKVGLEKETITMEIDEDDLSSDEEEALTKDGLREENIEKIIQEEMSEEQENNNENIQGNNNENNHESNNENNQGNSIQDEPKDEVHQK